MPINLNAVDKKFDKLCELIKNNQLSSINTKLNLVNEIANLGGEGLSKLLLLLTEKFYDQNETIGLLDEYIYQLLLSSRETKILSILESKFPDGITSLKSDLNIDYRPLQQLLLYREFKEADKLTQYLLCQISQEIHDHSRSWLYFTDISSLPSTDLQTIDKLWKIHSLGLFGISVQRDIWLRNDSNWEKFWHKIGWKINNSHRRYPQEFTWNIKAPEGHLPLFNQLRGVQVLAALFTHPAWKEQEY